MEAHYALKLVTAEGESRALEALRAAAESDGLVFEPPDAFAENPRHTEHQGRVRVGLCPQKKDVVLFATAEAEDALLRAIAEIIAPALSCPIALISLEDQAHVVQTWNNGKKKMSAAIGRASWTSRTTSQFELLASYSGLPAAESKTLLRDLEDTKPAAGREVDVKVFAAAKRESEGPLARCLPLYKLAFTLLGGKEPFDVFAPEEAWPAILEELSHVPLPPSIANAKVPLPATELRAIEAALEDADCEVLAITREGPPALGRTPATYRTSLRIDGATVEKRLKLQHEAADDFADRIKRHAYEHRRVVESDRKEAVEAQMREYMKTGNLTAAATSYRDLHRDHYEGLPTAKAAAQSRKRVEELARLYYGKR